jgi:hypothetical protein
LVPLRHDGSAASFINDRRVHANFANVGVGFVVCFDSYSKKVDAAVVIQKYPVGFDNLTKQ